MLIYNTAYEYLTIENKFDTKGIPLVVNVSSNSYFSRFKVGSKFLALHDSVVYFADGSDDNTVFIKKLGFGFPECFLNKDNEILSCVSGRLSSVKYDAEILGYFSYFKPNIHLDYPRTRYLQLYNHGLITIKSNSPSILEARKILHSKDEKRICNLYDLDPCFSQLLNDPLLKETLVKIFQGNEFHLTTYSSNTLAPNSGVTEGGWHVDYPYHDISAPYPYEILGVQVIFALDDFTPENGATKYVPGSHNERTWPSSIERYDYLTGEAGTIFIYLGTLWHTESFNFTLKKRSAVLANFSPLSVKPKDEMGEFHPFKMIDGKLRYQ